MSDTRIVINGRFLTQRVTGVQRFALETVRAMDGLLGLPRNRHLQGRIAILAPRGAPNDIGLKNIAIRFGGIGQGYLWEQFQLPLLARDTVLINLCALGPALRRRQLTIIHDVTFLAMPQTFSRGVRLLYRLIVPTLAHRSAVVMAVSEFTRAEMHRALGLDPTYVAVCGEGSEHILETAPNAEVLDRLELAGKRFFLAVGMGGPNKNLPALLAAFAAMPTQVALVITGRPNPHIHPDNYSTGENVIYAGYVGDVELRALYERALALVYPSLYEGFGLPPLEAMACGCPVIGSDQPALVEIAGGSALHVPAYDAERLGEAMRTIVQDEALRAELSRRGRERAKHFCWRNTAQIILAAAERI